MEARQEHPAAQSITLPGGGQARLVRAKPGEDASEILHKLRIEKPHPVIVVSGGASALDPALEPRLAALLGEGVARAAAEAGAAIVDGGTRAGIMGLMGRAIANLDHRPLLAGVAPAGKVTWPGGPSEGSIEGGAPLEPNHSHFILVEGNAWGDETSTLLAAADRLGRGRHIVFVLANGGDISRQELLRAVELGWPILLIEGSGRLADELSRLVRLKQELQQRQAARRKNLRGWLAWVRSPRRLRISDPMMAKLISAGQFHLLGPEEDSERLRELLGRLLHRTPSPMLSLAWKRFAELDGTALHYQRLFRGLQGWILGLSVLVTALAAAQVTAQRTEGSWLTALAGVAHSWLPSATSTLSQEQVTWTLHKVLVVIPLIIGGLTAYSHRFDIGGRWVQLRSAAEAVKREIYRYRTRVGAYSTSPSGQARTHRDAELALRINAASTSLMSAELSTLVIEPYEGPCPPPGSGAQGDDGMKVLLAEDYVSFRIEDQIRYFRRRGSELERRLKRLQIWTYAFTALGSLLAAFSAEFWVPLTTALVSALATQAQSRRFESTLAGYTQTEAALESLRMWWEGLSRTERQERQTLKSLVSMTEQVLESEGSAWVRQMHDALAELRQDREKRSKREEAHRETTQMPSLPAKALSRP